MINFNEKYLNYRGHYELLSHPISNTWEIKYLKYKKKYINLKNKMQNKHVTIHKSLNLSFEENTYKQLIDTFKSNIVQKINIMSGGASVPNSQVRYIIEGNIGSGKTTLTELLGKYENVEIILEALDKWEVPIEETNLLKTFYSDTKRNSFLFEIVCLYTTAMNYLTKQNEFIRFCERSIWSVLNVFVKLLKNDKLLTPLEAYYIDDFFNWIEKMLPKPNGIFYVRCNPEISLKRINIRKRPGEEGIKLDLINKIHNAHEEWFCNWTKETEKDHPPIYIIDNDKDDNFDVVIDQIFKFLGFSTPKIKKIKKVF